MADDTEYPEKDVVLTETVIELKKQLNMLNQKRAELQQRLEDIKSGLELKHREEQRTEELVKHLMEAEARLEGFMSDEDGLLRDKLQAEHELQEVRRKLAKVDELKAKIEEGNNES